jgi:phosphatidylserine decarboxylase
VPPTTKVEIAKVAGSGTALGAEAVPPNDMAKATSVLGSEEFVLYWGLLFLNVSSITKPLVTAYASFAVLAVRPCIRRRAKPPPRTLLTKSD